MTTSTNKTTSNISSTTSSANASMSSCSLDQLIVAKG